jgi:hypothetical protein
MSGSTSARATQTRKDRAHRDSSIATIVPSHGQGRLAPPFRPGVAANPTGKHRSFREVRELARAKTLSATQALIDIVEARDENGRLLEDGRVVVVAATALLTWAYGKPPDYDPTEDRVPMKIDTSNLTREERAALLAIMRKGVLKQDLPDDPPVIDATADAAPDAAP